MEEKDLQLLQTFQVYSVLLFSSMSLEDQAIDSHPRHSTVNSGQASQTVPLSVILNKEHLQSGQSKGVINEDSSMRNSEHPGE